MFLLGFRVFFLLDFLPLCIQETMLNRPFFHSYSEKTLTERGARCEACQRTHSASFVVTLSGGSYDSDALWNGNLLPLDFLSIQDSATRAEESENPSESDPQFTSPVVFQVGSHCHKRAQLYHRLAHFKANLIMQIQVCFFFSAFQQINSIQTIIVCCCHNNRKGFLLWKEDCQMIVMLL